MPLRLGQEIQEVLRPQLTNRHRPGLLADTPIPCSSLELARRNSSDRGLRRRVTDIARELEDIVGDKKLAPRFGSDVRRTLRMVTFRSAEIEVALDDGFLFAGDRREPTHEIELELKTGEPAALFEFGLALLDALPLKLGVLSKARRGALLLSGEPPAPVYATSPALSAHMTTEEAIGALLRNGLGHFLGNLPVLERGDPVEAVHQLRVAMRRLRSAFSLVYRFFPSAEFDALREKSRRIGTALGEARDWDVFVESLSEGAPAIRGRRARVRKTHRGGPLTS